MNTEKEQIDSLIHSFQELVENPAYKFMLKKFDSVCLNNLDSDLQSKAERYIAESAVKAFIRDIDSYAAGIPDELPEESLALEDEDEEIDEDEDIFDTEN